MLWLNVILQGVLIGGLYAMFAAGLSLIFGVMRLVNIAHGDLIVLAAYVALMATSALGITPLVSLLVVVPVMALIGYALQRGLLNRTLGDDLLPPLLVTFGLSIIIQNGLLEFFSADSRKLQAGAIEVATLQVTNGLWIGLLPLLQFVIAVAVIAGLQLLFYRTALGRAFRATSDDQAVAQLMGLDTRHVFALAMAISLAVVAIAGDNGEQWSVTTPGWRPDIDGAPDIVEEVIRIHGLDKVESVPLPRAEGVARPTATPAQKLERRVRRAAAGLGLNEAITWSFISEREAAAVGGGHWTLSNPISEDMRVMRPSLLPGLLSAARRNLTRGAASVRLFEIGRRYLADGEHPSLVLVLAGDSRPRDRAA